MRDGAWFRRCDGRSGEESELEDAPNPAGRAECFPNPKCSQPKCPPAWPPPEYPPEECPPEE